MNKIELLSPVGDFECLKAAVQSGANCVYFGGNLFNARASASNFDDDELKKAIEYAKLRNVKTNLTLNVLIKNDEFSDALCLAKKAYEYGIDAIIVQDLGLAKELIRLFPDLPIHASTQMTIHNLDGVLEAERLGFKRVVLSRELSVDEIKYICDNSNIEIEVFVHGALCICYSGQCLLSSMIGGRSGNRGRCAQPCRLPYELIKESSNTEAIHTLDKGHLLSPRDLCSLDLLPTLVNLGITCFKIEGRLKNPEYVSTVTRIYRKYIDLAQSGKPYVIDDNDRKSLLQVFNRGGFSTGYLDSKPHQNLIFKDKPNNMGLPLGKVLNFNSNKGYITLKLQDSLAIGDTVSLENEKGSYSISELMINNRNVPSAGAGNLVKIGRIKGKISVNDKIYKMSSKQLGMLANEYVNQEKVKSKINCRLVIHKNEPISMTVYTDDNSSINTVISSLGVYNESSNLRNSSANTEATFNYFDTIYRNINFTIVSDLVPIEATNSPITAERVIEQINKLGGTPYEFGRIDVDLEDNLYIPSISKLNQLRRDCISKLENILIDRIHRRFDVNRISLTKNTDVSNNVSTFSENTEVSTNMATCSRNVEVSTNIVTSSENTEVSILLNMLNKDYNYKNIESVDSIYIPLKYYLNPELHSTILDIAQTADTYIYMPSVLKDTLMYAIRNNISQILANFPLKGFVISNIAHIHMLEKYIGNYNFIANYTMNIYNTATACELEKLGISCITLSPELDKFSINPFSPTVNENTNAKEGTNAKMEVSIKEETTANMEANIKEDTTVKKENNVKVEAAIRKEAIVYGSLPVMTTNYCPLSKSNFCLQDCNSNCTNPNAKYYLKDRLNMNFRLIPDCFSRTSTIYNSKKLSISPSELNTDSIRLDFLDESFEDINEIISAFKRGDCLTGKDFTNGNFNRVV